MKRFNPLSYRYRWEPSLPGALCYMLTWLLAVITYGVILAALWVWDWVRGIEW